MRKENDKTRRKSNFNLKKQNGITLIALVVTIVVLLILAGVTINMLFGSDGIFNIANQAREQYEIGAIKDRISNVIADWGIDRFTKPGVTVDDLWDKMVDADIISNPEEDVEGPEKEGENDVYQVTTNEGYVVEVIINPDGNVTIGDVVKGDSLPPKIVSVETTSGTNNIQVTVTMSRWENGTIRYYYKKDGEEDTSYKAFQENTTELTANIKGLDQNVVYNIKIVAENENGSTEKVVNERTGELKGTVTQKGATQWNNGIATIYLETQVPDVNILYQINSTNGTYLPYDDTKGITDLKYQDAVYAVISDGTNITDYASINILDDLPPQSANIQLSGQNTTTAGSVTATVTHIDNESGVDIANCKWVYNTNPDEIGTGASSYPNTFNSNGETITLSATEIGTYYLHVLTQDKAGNKKETISQAITVTQLVTRIILNQTNITLEEGETLQLTATIEPSNASNQTLTWNSNSNIVASVSSTGLVTAESAGSTIITVRANDESGVTATCNVTVTPPLPTIEAKLRAGNYVYYYDQNNVQRKCIVLYDTTSEYGVQIMTKDTVENVTLMSTDFNTSINLYNNAISTLNARARTYLNTTYVSSARSIGSVPNNPKYDAAGMLTSSYNYMSSYNGKLKDTDQNYLADWNQMYNLGILASNSAYWMASRNVKSESETTIFCIRIMGTDGVLYSNSDSLSVSTSNGAKSRNLNNGLRVVFTLKPGIKVTGGSGTESSPYTLGI